MILAVMVVGVVIEVIGSSDRHSIYIIIFIVYLFIVVIFK